MDERFLTPYAEIRELRAKARRVLGVGEDAGPEQIKQAFRTLARLRHPDVTSVAGDFTQVVNAYLVLTRGDPRGFAVEPAPEPRAVPETDEAYLAWWKKRFGP
ncbi:MAG: DnaJ domain-containing protein [Thermodesulfobacteriota bacterium]|jgi:hypothetical protein